MRPGALHRWFVVASLAAVLAVTLFPSASDEPERWVTCVVCGERGTADVLLNVLLFLPLGAALTGVGLPLSRCVLGGALLSAGIEFAQLYIPGRDPSVGDVVFNTVGSGLGAGLVAAAPYWLLPTPLRAAPLFRAATLAAMAVCYATGWLLAPALPRSHYVALWTPNIAGLEWYRGRVRDAAIGDIPVPAGAIANSAAVRERLLSPQGFSVQIHAIAGPRTADLGGFLAVHDESGSEMLLLGPDGDDLVFRLRTRAASWGLDQPDVRVTGALQSVAPGDTLDVTVRDRDGRFSTTVNASSATGLGYTVASGWAILLYPEVFPNWFKTLLSLAWIAALWVPAGFWARTRRDTWVIGGASAASLLGVPAVTPLCPTPLLQWAAAALGGLAGAGVRLLLDHRFRGSAPRPVVR
ncbi:MAG TPA: VanZ family protein [Gemmatimonadales bacterium]|nr:VanZ family protein [Gemmatimonadales bacterium]